MGEVYRARDTKLNRHVALKMLLTLKTRRNLDSVSLLLGEVGLALADS